MRTKLHRIALSSGRFAGLRNSGLFVVALKRKLLTRELINRNKKGQVKLIWSMCQKDINYKANDPL